MRRIYSEFVPWDVLDRPLLAALGRHHVDQIAVAGERETVLSDPRFQARYGTVVNVGEPT